MLPEIKRKMKFPLVPKLDSEKILIFHKTFDNVLNFFEISERTNSKDLVKGSSAVFVLSSSKIYRFLANVPILYPLKTPENL